MSIVKDVNVNGTTSNDTKSLLEYLTDKLKTDGGKYVAGLGFITNNYFDEFQAVKMANQKTSGRQFRQITISPSPAGNELTHQDYLNMGIKIARHYYGQGFQVLVTVHLDTKTVHLHMAVNSVNFRTGKMFSQSKSELNRFKLHCDHVFTDYGLDPIGKPAETMIDPVVHEMSEGFDCLEIYDEILADKARIFDDLYDEQNSTTIEDDTSSDYIAYKAASLPITTGYYNYNKEQEIAHEEENNMEYTEENNTLPTLNNSQLPDQSVHTSGLIIDCSRNVNLKVPSNYNNSQISDLINSVEPVSEQDRAYNAKIGIGSLAELRNRGCDVPVYVNNSTNINVVFDDIMNSSSDIFDAPFTID